MNLELIEIELDDVTITNRIKANSYYELMNKLPVESERPMFYIVKENQNRNSYFSVQFVRAWLESELAKVQ